MGMGIRGLRLAGVGVGYASGYAADKLYTLRREYLKDFKNNPAFKDKDSYF